MAALAPDWRQLTSYAPTFLGAAVENDFAELVLSDTQLYSVAAMT